MPDFPQASSFNRLIGGKIGFLTRSLSPAPSQILDRIQWLVPGIVLELTAAGTVPAFNRIP